MMIRSHCTERLGPTAFFNLFLASESLQVLELYLFLGDLEKAFLFKDGTLLYN